MATTVKISKPAWAIAESMSVSDFRNSYFGGSNLTAEYLNDYSSEGVNRFLADWIDDHAPCNLVETVDILENPDSLIQAVACELASAIMRVTGREDDFICKNANCWFDAWGKFYLYANADIACTYIIRAENESEAYQELVTRFEPAFACEESDETNDNGTPINTGYLVFLGTIKGE